MDDSAIVIMLKNRETGFLEKELGFCTIEKDEMLIDTIYAEEKDGSYEIIMKLTCDREVNDWEYDAIYDYYDTEILLNEVNSVEEEAEVYNPTWKVCFDFIEDSQQLNEKINSLLKLHKKELESVYEAIADKKDDYIDDTKQ